MVRLAAIFAVVAIAGDAAATEADHRQNGKDRLFAYMHTRNEAGTKERTHVFALTEAGTLAERVTSQLDDWRFPPNSDAEPYRFNCTLDFPTKEQRNSKAIILHNSVAEYNDLVTLYFEREGKAAPSDHLFEMREKFGPLDDHENANKPTQDELNQLHERFALLSGVGTTTVSNIWGNWTELLHRELVERLSHTSDGVHNLEFTSEHSAATVKGSLVLRMHRRLEAINGDIHKVETQGVWAVKNRFTFNPVGLGCPPKTQTPLPFLEEDLEPDRWRLALEMGGLYLSYAKIGKNLLNIMHNNDLGPLESTDSEERSQIQFQDSFNQQLYVVWSLANETEANKRQQFQDWWNQHEITNRFGYVFGQRDQPNGFIRFGQQVCDPPSDCDRPWHELIDEFAKTPEVIDIDFSDAQPYGETNEDLRFLYPGDDAIIEQTREGCCGGKVYQYDTQGCCNNAHLWVYGAEGCCGGNADGTGGTFHTWKEEGCCGGNIYDYSQQYCDGDEESGSLKDVFAETPHTDSYNTGELAMMGDFQGIERGNRWSYDGATTSPSRLYYGPLQYANIIARIDKWTTPNECLEEKNKDGLTVPILTVVAVREFLIGCQSFREHLSPRFHTLLVLPSDFALEMRLDKLVEDAKVHETAGIHLFLSDGGIGGDFLARRVAEQFITMELEPRGLRIEFLNSVNCDVHQLPEDHHLFMPFEQVALKMMEDLRLAQDFRRRGDYIETNYGDSDEERQRSKMEILAINTLLFEYVPDNQTVSQFHGTDIFNWGGREGWRNKPEHLIKKGLPWLVDNYSPFEDHFVMYDLDLLRRVKDDFFMFPRTYIKGVAFIGRFANHHNMTVLRSHDILMHINFGISASQMHFPSYVDSDWLKAKNFVLAAAGGNPREQHKNWETAYDIFVRLDRPENHAMLCKGKTYAVICRHFDRDAWLPAYSRSGSGITERNMRTIFEAILRLFGYVFTGYGHSNTSLVFELDGIFPANRVLKIGENANRKKWAKILSFGTNSSGSPLSLFMCGFHVTECNENFQRKLSREERTLEIPMEANIEEIYLGSNCGMWDNPIQCGGSVDGTGGTSFDWVKEGCCGGNNIIDKTREGCCGGKVYQYDKQGCCNHSHVWVHGVDGCCGGNADGTGGAFHAWKEEGCCGGNIYDYSKQHCDGDEESGNLKDL